MRLRLTVRRHNLPDCPIIWDVNTSTSAPTVSELLDQINDVIPIESTEWGMEDYAVEVKGKDGVNYECLHFQPVGKVMKEEDEVIIRPLLTHDLRVRRISGRHQISSDGKHLVDGVAFGRPLLKRPVNRPAIDIPPRKRRRVTIDEEDEENEDLNDAEPGIKRIAFQSKPEDEDDEDDDDFEPGGDEDEDEESDENNTDTEENPGSREVVLHEDFEDDDEESDEEVEDTSNRQLVLRADFEDDDEDDDEDFEPGFGEKGKSEESEEAFEGFQDDQPTSSAPGDNTENSCKGDELSTADQDVLSGVKNASTKAKICKLHMAFPTASIAVVNYVLEGSDRDVSQAYEALVLGYVPVKPKSFILQVPSSDSKLPQPLSKSQIPKSSEAGITFKHTDPAPANEMDLDDEASSSEEEEDALLQHYDQHGLPPGSIISGKALSFMAEAMEGSPNPKSKLTKFANFSTRNDTNVIKGDLSDGLKSTPAIDLKLNDDEITVDSDDSSDWSSEAESSSGDSSGDSDDSSSEDDSSEDDSSEAAGVSSSNSDSDSSSDSSSDDEAPEVKSSKLAAPVIEATKSKPTPSAKVIVPKSQMPVPPRQGKKSTHARNQRRKQGIALAKFKERGILPEDTTVSEFNRLEVSNSTSPDEASAALSALRANTNSAKIQNETSKALAEAEEFDARRRELLASLASGGIEVSPRSGKTVIDTMDVDVPEMVSGAPKTGKNTSKEPAAISETTEVPPQEDNPTPTSANKLASASRRARIDVGAGRRLLFGALGVKNPKTKKDEEKLRNDLMKGVRIPKTTGLPEEHSDQQTENPAIDDDSWRDKIIYRAVECCQDDIVLSEPPFPFVQRWDPQQQYYKGRKRKNQTQAYNEESQGSKKRKRRKGKQNYSEEQEEFFDESYQPSYEEDATETQSTEPPARQVESVEHRTDIGDLVQETPDLVELPEDPTTLPNLDENAVEAGMIIAFKQMLMDETTKWQPQISAYRTASVLSVGDDGNILVALARRDRDRPVKHYDENGQRIWGKFEMPDDDYGEEEEDNGEMVVTLNELVEPKIVAPAPVSLSTEISKTGMTIDESVILNGKEEETQCSHVTETQYFDTDQPALPESITDSAEEGTSHLIEEAGFRPNDHSPIIRDFAPNGLEARDEAPTLQKLRTEITAEIDDAPFSPKFNGFGSNSPVRQQQSTISPDRQESSWQTLGSEEPSSVPDHDKLEMMENRGSETTAQKDVSKNTPQEISKVPSIHTKLPSKKINVDKAQAVWEIFQPQGKAASPVEADATLDTIEVDCKAADSKFSGESSFTSLVTDHGRQPDFSFDNIRNQELDTSKADDMAMHMAARDGDMSEDEFELPPLRPNSSSKPVQNNNMVEPSSEDFPTIQEMLSQGSQSLTRPEKGGSQPSSKFQAGAEKTRKVLAAFDDTQSSATKKEGKSKKVLAAFGDSDSDSDSDALQMKAEVELKEADIKSKKVMAAFDPSSDEEDQITPKASKPSNPRPAQNITSKIPPSSQVVMDLTLSSDIEPETDKGKSKRHDSDGDDDFEVGWGAKTKSNLKGLKRQGSNSLGGTTNTSLNVKTSKRRF